MGANYSGLALPTMLEWRGEWEKLKREGYEPQGLIVRDAGKKGLGVFATRNFEPGEVVEYCHCVRMSVPHHYCADRGIKQYAYWDSDGPDAVKHGPIGLIVLGHGSIYNSAESEQGINCDWFTSEASRLVVFAAVKPIRAGQEILTWWGQQYYDSWCKEKPKK
jgi:hypothetical protein